MTDSIKMSYHRGSSRGSRDSDYGGRRGGGSGGYGGGYGGYGGSNSYSYGGSRFDKLE